MGGRFLSVYMTMGMPRHDHHLRRAGRRRGGALHLLLGKQGNVRTKSLKAFPEEAYRQIVNSLR